MALILSVNDESSMYFSYVIHPTIEDFFVLPKNTYQLRVRNIIMAGKRKVLV
jgi:hypothetical protein